MFAVAGASTTANAAPTWTTPITLGPTVPYSEPPQIAITPEGEALVAWEGVRPKGIRVTSRRRGQGWSRPSAIGTASEGVPQIAATGQKAVVVWAGTIRARGVEAPVVFASTRLRGGRWSEPEKISAEKGWRYQPPEGSEPRVAVTDRGEAIAMWTAGDERHSNTSFIRSATQPLGKDWTSPIGIPGSIEGEEPELVVTPQGEAVAIWHAFYNEESGVDAVSRPEGEKWSGVERLANPGAFPKPDLGITRSGEAVAVWEFEEPEGLQAATKEPGRRWGVRTLMSAEYERSSAPQVVTGLGGPAVTWVRSGSAVEDEDAVSTHPGGGGWTKPASIFGKGVEARRPVVAVTKGGEWIAVWKAPGPAGGSIIQASRRRRGQRWEAPVTLSTTPAAATPSSSDPRIAVAPDGEAFALWREYDGRRWVIQVATRGR